MAQSAPAFTLGIEEEYLLVDLETLDLVAAPEALMAQCSEALEAQVSPEFLKCQIEIGTRVCADIGAAREDLRRLRSVVSDCANRFGLAPIAASCHPFADWKAQSHTDKERYNALQTDLAGVARRMLICGMHVHVGIESRELRIDLMNQLSYFLPHLLALSTSSPFWQGEDTGLSSYRLTVFDNLPRTGLPPQLNSWATYERTTGILVDLGIIEDTSKIWWDLRPSSRFPTLESRICDVPCRMEDSLTLAAVTQCICRMLWRLSRQNQRWRTYDGFLLGENRWRAQRYGVSRGMIDFGAQAIKPFDALAEELMGLLAEDADALGCSAEVARVQEIAEHGTGADRQRAAREAALARGESKTEAMRSVVRHLIEESALGSEAGAGVAEGSEAALYAPVKALLEAQGYAVKGEVGPADVVAVRGAETPVIVELKRGFALALFHQAIERLRLTDAVYVAVPEGRGARWRGALKANAALCRRLGLGLILVHGGGATVALDPGPYAPRKAAGRRRALLREFARREGDPVAGGLPAAAGRVTAYRQEALRLAAHLAESGPCAGAAAAAATGVARATRMMADNHYGWFERVSRGVYALTASGRAAIAPEPSAAKGGAGPAADAHKAAQFPV